MSTAITTEADPAFRRTVRLGLGLFALASLVGFASKFMHFANVEVARAGYVNALGQFLYTAAGYRIVHFVGDGLSAAAYAVLAKPLLAPLARPDLAPLGKGFRAIAILLAIKAVGELWIDLSTHVVSSPGVRAFYWLAWIVPVLAVGGGVAVMTYCRRIALDNHRGQLAYYAGYVAWAYAAVAGLPAACDLAWYVLLHFGSETEERQLAEYGWGITHRLPLLIALVGPAFITILAKTAMLLVAQPPSFPVRSTPVPAEASPEAG